MLQGEAQQVLVPRTLFRFCGIQINSNHIHHCFALAGITSAWIPARSYTCQAEWLGPALPVHVQRGHGATLLMKFTSSTAHAHERCRRTFESQFLNLGHMGVEDACRLLRLRCASVSRSGRAREMIMQVMQALSDQSVRLYGANESLNDKCKATERIGCKYGGACACTVSRSHHEDS